MASFTIGDAFHEGWAITKPNIWQIWKFMLVIGAVMIAFNLLGSFMGSALRGLMSFIGYIVAMMLSLGFIRVMLKLVDGQVVKLDDMFWFEGKAIWAYFIASILYSLLVWVGILLLIIPGIIWALMYGQYQYAIADKVMGTFEALKYSQKIMRGNKWQYLLLGFTIGLMNMGAMLLFVIPLIVTIPLSSVISVWVFRQMQQKADVGDQDKLTAAPALTV